MMNLIENPITTHKHARWIALYTYLIGMVCTSVGYLLQSWWSVIIMQFGLVLWIIPVMWAAYRWSKS